MCLDHLGPQQPRFDFFELTQALQRIVGFHFKFWGKLIYSTSSRIPTMLHSAWGRWPQEPISTLSMDSPGLQQPKLNIYELTGPSEGPRVPFQIKQEFEFIISFKKPFNMGDY